MLSHNNTEGNGNAVSLLLPLHVDEMLAFYSIAGYYSPAFCKILTPIIGFYSFNVPGERQALRVKCLAQEQDSVTPAMVQTQTN